MPKNSSPIRWDKIKEARKFLKENEMIDATANVQMFHLFRNRKQLEDGLSFRELCIIRHGKRCYKNDKNEVVIPIDVERQVREEIRRFRKDMNRTSLILYSVKDKMTGAAYLINITTLQLYEIVERQVNKIIKGLQDNKKAAKDILKMTSKERRKYEKARADEYRRKILDNLKKKMERERKIELEKIIKQKEEERSRKEAEIEKTEEGYEELGSEKK